VNQPEHAPVAKEDTTELLQRELDEAQRMIRTLMRPLADDNNNSSKPNVPMNK
jgi:hypothetical protein